MMMQGVLKKVFKSLAKEHVLDEFKAKFLFLANKGWFLGNIFFVSLCKVYNVYHHILCVPM